MRKTLKDVIMLLSMIIAIQLNLLIMNKIFNLETGKSIPINQVFELATNTFNGEIDKKQVNGDDDYEICLFEKILRFQAIFGQTYGGSTCYFGNSKSRLKLKRLLLVIYELIIIIFVSIYYLYYFNQNDHIFELNVKRPAMKMILRLASDSYISTFIVFKLVLLVNGRAILKTIATFKQSHTNIESKVNINTIYSNIYTIH